MPTSEGNFDEEQDFSFFENGSPQLLLAMTKSGTNLTIKINFTEERQLNIMCPQV